MQTTEIPLSVSSHSSLSAIVISISRSLPLVSSMNGRMLLFVVRSNLVCPWIGVHEITSLTSSPLLHQQCHHILHVFDDFKIGDWYNSCFVGLIYSKWYAPSLSSSHLSFSSGVSKVQVVQPYSNAETATAWNY